ncbi:alpha/beta hydrolase [Chitinimonas prasina]|uniref:Alpha/beta hydrolase n=1 Tax=Chitinimonas prasina TaxID=1434937 RepID=A0ABQ5YH70_9NEIS|nr:alpha/beta hydrolase [Chitinimonas prasina]GLR13028.1 alpha/beta hydrolase [Chitinimonas prasina]
MPTTPIVLHPGWQNSGPEHWQSHWQASQPGSSRVPQTDWDRPELDDWIQTLDKHLAQQAQPVLLACHSLGCLTLLHWLAHYPQHHHRIVGALLVAPADVERDNAPTEIQGFAPIPRQRLPFPSIVVASDNDPYCQFARSQQLAQHWGSGFYLLTGAGHINAQSSLADWPEGLALLQGIANQQAALG